MIGDLTACQMLAGIVRMLVSIGWMYALVMTKRLGDRLSDASLEAMVRHVARIEAQR